VPFPPNRPEPVRVQPAGDPYAFRGNSNGNPLQKLNARVFIEVDGKIVGQRLLDKPVLTVGRLSGNDIQVPSQRVSRLHAKIRWESNAWVIEDVESLNGLVIRGQLAERHVLSNGDRIHLAPTAVVRFELIP
jgi:pSer/pThr/pTyr-binding forkhead associated (FHA) protein